MFGDRKQPDVARDDGRVKVIDDWSERVFVALYHLKKNKVHDILEYFKLVIWKTVDKEEVFINNRVGYNIKQNCAYINLFLLFVF